MKDLDEGPEMSVYHAKPCKVGFTFAQEILERHELYQVILIRDAREPVSEFPTRPDTNWPVQL